MVNQSSAWKHGQAGFAGSQATGAYNSWRGIRQRVLNPNNKDYPEYGGRGIDMDPRWLEFVFFYQDMGDRPDGMTLDRENVNGNYDRDNCKWATPTEQANNRRRRRWGKKPQA